MMPPWFLSRISDTFSAFCQDSGLVIMTLGVDKHGSLVWESAARTDGLNRYVTLALTEVTAEQNHSKKYSEEVIIGADDGTSYVSHVLDNLHVSTPKQGNGVGQHLSHLRHRLLDGWGRAQQITADELTHAYIMPRGDTQPELNTAG